jgi:hypothetical protein
MRVALAALLLSCHPPAPDAPAPPPECECPPSVRAEMREVMLERDSCRAELEQTASAPAKVHTRIVERQAPVTRCAPPRLESVDTWECQSGVLCLDAPNQARYSTNALKLRQYFACERGEQ